MLVEIIKMMVQIIVQMVDGYGENDGEDHHHDIDGWEDEQKKDKVGDDEIRFSHTFSANDPCPTLNSPSLSVFHSCIVLRYVEISKYHTSAIQHAVINVTILIIIIIACFVNLDVFDLVKDAAVCPRHYDLCLQFFILLESFRILKKAIRQTSSVMNSSLIWKSWIFLMSIPSFTWFFNICWDDVHSFHIIKLFNLGILR